MVTHGAFCRRAHYLKIAYLTMANRSKLRFLHRIKSNFTYHRRWLLRGEWSIFFVGMLKTFFLLYCVPLYVCRLCINYQDLRTNLLGMAALRILLLTFISNFVIDFLSIRKVIIFSAIATDDRHPLRSRSIHQNAKLHDDSFPLYCTTEGGYGKPTAHVT